MMTDGPLRRKPSRTSWHFCLIFAFFQLLLKVLDLLLVSLNESFRVHDFRLLCIQLKNCSIFIQGQGIQTNLDGLDRFGKKKCTSALRNGAWVRIDCTKDSDACISC
jgi:hypothetical protein